MAETAIRLKIILIKALSSRGKWENENGYGWVGCGNATDLISVVWITAQDLKHL